MFSDFALRLELVYRASGRKADNLSAKTKTTGSDTFGEIYPAPFTFLIQTLQSLRFKLEYFFDIGCGCGNIVFQAATLFGAKAFGIEIEKRRIDFARWMSGRLLSIYPNCFVQLYYVRCFFVFTCSFSLSHEIDE